MYLIVDALDECLEGLGSLLKLISCLTPRVKWIVSSRNRYEVEEYLEPSSKIGLSLELHEESVCQAVRYFIDYRTRQLVHRKKLKIDLARKVQHHLTQYAQGTFLWVALGLTELYARMLQEIRMSDSCDLYIWLLALASTVFRPLTFSELMAMEQLEQLERPEQLDLDVENLPDAIKECGSFLTKKEQTIVFIHQSARDFLLKESGALLFPSGLMHHHYTISQRSINMLEFLRKDMYCLEHPGASLDVAIRNRPEPDPLDSLKYALVFWYDHIRESYELSTREGIEVEIHFVETIYEFFSKKILFWIEALSLCHNLSIAGKTLLSLRDMPAVLSHPDLTALIEDAIRFLLLFGPVIEDYPLQTYASGLLFSPNKSLIRRIFNQYTPDFIARRPRVEEDWSPILSVFEVSQGTKIRIMSFSRTSKMLALTISNSQLLIWNVSDGSVLRRSKYDNATLLTTSPDLRCLASIIMSNSNDTEGLVQYALELRDLDSNNILWARTLDNREALVMEFAPDGKWLAVCYREELRLYTRQGEAARSWGLQLGPHAKHSDLLPWCLTFSTDCVVLLLRYYDEQDKLAAFDLRTGMQYGCPDLIDEDSDDLCDEHINDANFIPGTHQVMICGSEMGIYLWDVFKGECREWFIHSNYVDCLAFSQTDPWLFIASHGCLSLLDRHQKSLLHDVELPTKEVLKAIEVSYDGKQVAVCSSTTVWLLEVNAILANKPGSDRQEDGFPYISNNGTSIAHYDFENTIEMENQMTGVISTLDTKGIVRGLVNSMAFSPDGQLFAFSDDSSLYSKTYRDIVWRKC
ncbi:heterokaryon incompatibility protein het-E-1 [Fusarium beomiforme]|uniref:Heterokaryon incompatibility protein het-E-1 n=1 Tax=Fusarium beomiforme TaxID=44412 RepID=A0A9P5A7N6_9HYPO|nr:heterokaryon incompatibility protein het-E-1 [Fusarium beomiforme]